MPRVVVADSDDEDSSLSPPPKSPSPIINLEAGANRSSDHVSHETSSTDPAFFQNIYDEQNNATRVEELPERERLTSSEMTAPADFVPTKTGRLVDPSSLTSVTDPLAPKEKGSSSDKRMSDWTQVSTPGRKLAPVARMDDPWGVPSSPEDNPQPARKIKIRLRRSGEKTTTEPNPAPKQAVKDSGPRDDVGSPDGRRKRRKIASSDAAYNEVDLVTIPFTHEDEATQRNTQRHDDLEATQPNTQRPIPAGTMSSMLPPTLPFDNEPSFIVQPTTLSNSQKMEYQAIHLDSSGNTDHDTLPPLPNFDTHGLASSGSATNINTPRSNLGSVGQGPTQPSQPPASRTRRPSRLRRNSSPDIISTGETPAKRRKMLRNTEAIPETAIEDVLEVAEEKTEVQHDDESHTNNVEANQDDLNYAPEPVEKSTKVKKTRGRPKSEIIPDPTPIHQEVVDLTEDQPEEVQHIDDTNTNNRDETHDEPDYAPEPVKKPAKAKKTRGRPKLETVPDTIPILDEVADIPEEQAEEVQNYDEDYAPEPVKKAVKAKKTRGRPKSEATRDATPILEEAVDIPQEQAEEAQNYDEDYAPEPIAQPIKTKKTRGRPKKAADTQATQPAEVVNSPTGDGETGARQKKKRGRPRKSDQAAAAEKSPQVETNFSEDVAHIQKPDSKEAVESGTHRRVDETSHKQEDLEGSAGTKVEARTTPAPGIGAGTLKEISDNAVTTPALKKSETASSKDSDSREEAGGSAAKMTPDQKKPAIKGAGSISKPIYRVGLSKKSRIAPLLKSLRK